MTSPFVGRDDELRRLRAALNVAAEGQGGVVFLTGEPGIGKTRLAREALALAKARGFTVLEGRAFPLEAGLAYAPFIDAFGPLLRSFDSSHVGTLISDLPSLGRLFEGLQLPLPSVPSERLGDPALEKTRLFEAMSRLLERLARETPVSLFIDDVNRSDPATVDLLHYLARGVSVQRALLIATYSPQDNLRTLRAMVRSLARDGTAQEILVPRLGRDSVVEMARSILGGKVPGSVLALLDARASGTPLFVEALLVSLLESGNLVRSPAEKDGWTLNKEGVNSLPQNVRHLILDRLDRLAPTGRRVLDLIAVTGNATEYTLLQIASGLAEDTLIEGLQRLQIAGLVTESTEGSEVTYSISHPLIQEVACAELPEAARRRIHLAMIEALESLQGKYSAGQSSDPSNTSGRTLSRLAYHYLGAGPKANPNRAPAALIAAGERALGLYANEEAARCFEAALALEREDRGVTLPHVLERLGEAWERISRRGAAVEVWKEALAEREQAGDNVAASRLHRRLALAEWEHGHFDIANAHVRAGLAVLAGLEPCQELADMHFARFDILSRMGDMAGVAETAKQLLSLAEQLASPRLEAMANLVAGTSRLWHSDVIGARECALHALRVSEEAQELVMCRRAHCVLTLVYLRLGDHHFIRYHGERALALARRLSVPYLELLPLLRLAHADFLSGAWDESLRLGIEAIALSRRVGQPRGLAYALAERAIILAFQGSLSEAQACISEASAAFGTGMPMDRPVFGLIDIAKVTLALEWGQAARVLDIAEGFARALAPSTAVTDGLTPVFPPVGLTLLAEAQVGVGEPEAALETARKLPGLGPTGTPYLAALASRIEGLARKALGQQKAAMACYTQAHQTFEVLGMPFEAARCLLDQASLANTALPELAVSASQRSLVIFERLGAQRYSERARRLLGQFGISPVATCRMSLGGVPLTQREFEIARLVAQGLTTAEIARQLTLTPGTVSGHLHRIYTRLGIGSRTALAGLVIEAGLLSS